MDLLIDIRDLCRDDDEHHLRIEVDGSGITVYLIYDPALDYSEDYAIPIEYSIADKYTYIPDVKFRELATPGDFGLDLTEITLIKSIMEYLESHKKEIEELCKGFDIEDRKADEDSL